MFFVGIDIGGSSIKMGIFDEEGQLKKTGSRTTVREEGPMDALRKILSFIDEHLQENEWERLGGIGLGLPGVLNEGKNYIRESSNLKNWEQFPLKDFLETETGRPVIMDNDATMAALGEYWKGAGREANSMLMLTLGSGVGSAFVSHGKVMEMNGFSPEVGHMMIDLDGPVCHCGKRGCLETYAGRYGIQRILKETLKSAQEAGGHTDAGELHPSLTPLDLSQKAEEGNHTAREVLLQAGYALGVGISNVLNVFRVDQVVVGGGIANAWDGLFQHAEETIRQQAFRCRLNGSLIHKAALGESAGITGAGLSAVHHATTKKIPSK